MAPSANQKAQVRLYLGYPDQFRYKNSRLESILDNLSPEAEAQVVSCLTNLTTVEEQILSGQGSPIASAGIKRVDEIWFFGSEDGGNTGFKSLKQAGRFYVGRLSIIVGVPIYSDAFGSGGYLGDSFFGSNGGSTIRLG